MGISCIGKKHNGPLGAKGFEDRLDPMLRAYLARHDLEIHTYASAEAQVAALCDDIAYNNHDIDDGLRAGLFSLDDLVDLPLVGGLLEEVRRDHPSLETDRTRHELVRHVIDAMVRDLVAETIKRLQKENPQSDQAIRNLQQPVVAFSTDMRAHEKAIKAFLYANMYRHDRVMEMANVAKRVVGDLFSRYMAEPECLPEEWQAKTEGRSTSEAARTIADFIAGMTDRFATREHDRLFGERDKTV